VGLSPVHVCSLLYFIRAGAGVWESTRLKV
jgi:hypothetical protein